MESDRVARLLPTRVLAASSEMWATLAPQVPVSACIVGTPQEQGYPPYRGITDGFLGGSARARAEGQSNKEIARRISSTSCRSKSEPRRFHARKAWAC